MRFLSVVTVLLISVGWPVTGQAANIFKCDGNDGKPVFQQTPCDEGNISVDNAHHQLLKTMRSLAFEGKAILDGLGADVSSIKQCNRSMKKFSQKVEAIRSEVSRASVEFKDFAKAYGYIVDCAECRTSAASNCNMANRYLDRAVSKMTRY